jgi:cob(I)alamin adenosyltransferase
MTDCSGRKGKILVHTGPGKGKTTSGVGQIVRARGHGLEAKLVSFFKGDEERFPRGTFKVLRDLGVAVDNFVRDHPDFGRTDETEARKGCERAMQHLKEFFRGEAERFDLLVLDEVNVALSGGFIGEDEFLDLLEEKPEDLELVCTGRGAPEGLVGVADLVSRIENVKHFYDQGVVQRRGYEY